MEELSLIKIEDEKTKYRCDICHNQEEILLCDDCFKSINSTYEGYINNFINTENSISKKIDFLLTFKNEKSNLLNKIIKNDIYKQTLESRIKKEETLINKYKLELQNYEKELIKQKENNDALSYILKGYESENNNDNIDNSLININKSNLIYQNDNDNISKIKNDIFEINKKIKQFKEKYINDLFEELFNKNNIIKISDFFNDNQENNNNFSIIKINNNEDNENDYLFGKSINILVLKKNDYVLKKFNNFFKTMILFLEKAYQKFKLKFPFKINHFKIEYKNGIEYNCEIDKSQLNDHMALTKANKGYHLLNINYIFLMQNIFGDSRQLNDWFDISIFLEDKNDDIGSLEKILEESKNDKKEEEFMEFVIIND